MSDSLEAGLMRVAAEFAERLASGRYAAVTIYRFDGEDFVPCDIALTSTESPGLHHTGTGGTAAAEFDTGLGGFS